MAASYMTFSHKLWQWENPVPRGADKLRYARLTYQQGSTEMARWHTMAQDLFSIDAFD